MRSTGGNSHAGPGGQRPHCRTAKNITGEAGARWVRGGCGGDRPSGARRAVWAPVPGGAPTPGSHLRVQAVCAPGSAPGSGGSVHGSPHRGAGGPVPYVRPDRAREAPGRRPRPPGRRGRSRQEDVPGGAAPGLFLAVHHLVMDGVSWRIVLDDLATAYAQLT
ncbi:condensation domain-containing protein, partial [Streptomyces tirandamycinicus]|uniref:condensation domain-containing protein n=1 Tax=Streptomyces tirandamycinicus TaxID=2174846 RepID=UPI00398458C5